MNKIVTEVFREEGKKRYAIVQRQNGIEWTVFLSDSVYYDPRMFSAWLRSVFADIQLKSNQ